MDLPKDKKSKKKSVLSVSSGVQQPPSVNREAFELTRKKKKKQLTAEEYVNGILNHDPVILSQAITIIESSRPDHQKTGQEIVEKCLPYCGDSVRLGITGIPGVGKSTFIEEFGFYVTSAGRKLAVLAIDPSSERSGGSILGDKTRMEKLSSDPNVFIRPSPSAGSLGGVARKTRETIFLCEAAGFDTLFIETVGVGQSETAVHSMVDFFLLLMLAGSGDELQGIKRGIIEMADAIAITKADGHNIKKSERAKIDFRNALHFYPPTESGWMPRVLTCSAVTHTSLKEIWEMVQEYIEMTLANSWFQTNRKRQSTYWMYKTIEENLKDHFYQNPSVKKKLIKMEDDVLLDKTSSFKAAYQVLEEYFKKKGK